MITLDTNIYVSALQYGGMPMELLQRALNGDVEIAISQAILDETLRVPGQKFDWSVDDLSAGRNLILSFARMVEPQDAIHVIAEDPTDNRILECAAEAGADCILSGDRHLLRLGEYSGIPILRVSDFLQRGMGRHDAL